MVPKLKALNSRIFIERCIQLTNGPLTSFTWYSDIPDCGCAIIGTWGKDVTWCPVADRQLIHWFAVIFYIFSSLVNREGRQWSGTYAMWIQVDLYFVSTLLLSHHEIQKRTSRLHEKPWHQPLFSKSLAVFHYFLFDVQKEHLLFLKQNPITEDCLACCTVHFHHIMSQQLREHYNCK